MLREIRSKRLRILFNGEFTIQRIEFYDEKGQILCVMFKKWGVYTPQSPTPIRLEVECGGFILNDDGENVEMSNCFLVGQAGSLGQPNTRAEVRAFVLRNKSFDVIIGDEAGEIPMVFSQNLKMRGTTQIGEESFTFHEWSFDFEIRLVVGDKTDF